MRKKHASSPWRLSNSCNHSRVYNAYCVHFHMSVRIEWKRSAWDVTSYALNSTNKRLKCLLSFFRPGNTSIVLLCVVLCT